MFATGEKAMVALSGGADSVCLLHLLLELRDELGISLCAAHLNHMLRGAEAEREAEFAASLAERLGVPCVTGSADVRGYARENKKLSLQQAARELRYSFLKEKAAEQGAGKIALGHNANDQAETILMNVLRGSGAAGLSGIPPVREGVYVRPIIEIERGEVEKYLNERGIQYVTDPSNLKTDYLRNKIRLELIPLLERDYNPRLVHGLATMGDIIREESRAVERWVEELMPQLSLKCSTDRMEVDIGALMGLSSGHRRRALRHILMRMGAGPTSMDSVKIYAIESLLESRKSGKSLRLAGDLEALVEFDRLILWRGAEKEKGEQHVMLNVPGVTAVPAWGIRFIAEIVSGPPFDLSSGRGDTASMDYGKLCGAPVIRNRRAGDRFSPLGLSGSKKLKDYLIELRVPASKRDDLPLVADKDGILWVVGGRVSERVKVDPETGQVLQLRVEKND